MEKRSATGDDSLTGAHQASDQALLRLMRAHSLNQPATDEARSADQRATVIAAVASLAASLSPAGATLLLDEGKLIRPLGVRIAFGVALLLAVLCFLIAAILALGVHRRKWPPRDTVALDGSLRDDAEVKMHAMAAAMEDNFASNWRTAQDKHRGAVLALQFLIAGLAFILVLTAVSLLSAMA